MMNGCQFPENCTGLRKLRQVPVVVPTSIDPEDTAKGAGQVYRVMVKLRLNAWGFNLG